MSGVFTSGNTKNKKEYTVRNPEKRWYTEGWGKGKKEIHEVKSPLSTEGDVK